jgi:hypothetical protein
MTPVLLALLTQGPTAPSLCIKGEVAFFTCTTKTKKTISLCGQSLPDDGSWMEYRFGKVGKKPELAYPPTHLSPSAVFERGNLMFSKGGGHWIRFTNEKTRYTVFSARGHIWEKNGILIEPEGKSAVTVMCDSKTYKESGPSWEDLKVPEAAQQDSFELP